jgi:drug/metabolite transporter, DME family
LKQPNIGFIGSIYILLAAILWGTTGTAQAFAPDSATPAAVGAVRLAIGGFALLIVAAAGGGIEFRRGWPLLATGLAAGSMAAYQLSFFAAVSSTGVVVGTLVAIGSAPILAGVLSWIIHHEIPSRGWYTATGLAILGCSLLIASGTDLTINTWGIILAFGAGASYATYAVFGKILLREHHPQIAMAVVFCLAAIVLSPLLFRADMSWLVEENGLVVALHLGLVTTALAYTLFGRGLQVVPVANAVTLSLAEPLTAGTLGIILLGERFSVIAFTGILILFAGLIVLTLDSRTKTDTKTPHPRPEAG